MRALLLPLAFSCACAFAQTTPLNDTGQAQCFDAATNVLSECTAANTGDQSLQPRQDGRFGRDVQAAAGALIKIGSGELGFDFTKICNSGEAAGTGACPADPALGVDPNQWACTRDNVTGLIWEVKVNDSSQLRHRTHFYTWNDGTTGAPGFDTCNSTLDACNMENYRLAVNAAGLCGLSDWRVPTRRQLLSIVHHGRQGLAIDPAFFPNAQNTRYWAREIYGPVPDFAWVVETDDGAVNNSRIDNTVSSLRLVHSGQ